MSLFYSTSTNGASASADPTAASLQTSTVAVESRDEKTFLVVTQRVDSTHDFLTARYSIESSTHFCLESTFFNLKIYYIWPTKSSKMLVFEATFSAVFESFKARVFKCLSFDLKSAVRAEHSPFVGLEPANQVIYK